MLAGFPRDSDIPQVWGPWVYVIQRLGWAWGGQEATCGADIVLIILRRGWNSAALDSPSGHIQSQSFHLILRN